MDLGLKGKTVLITGGSKGIGLACAMSFAAEGCALHLAARNRELLESARRVKATFLRGALICENGNPVGKPRGRYLHRPTA